MKKIQKLSLVQLEQHELTNREMKNVKGGSKCTCGCCDHLPGYSGAYENGKANCEGGLSAICDGGGGSGWLDC